MEIRFTLAAAERAVDVVVTAPDGTTLGEIASQLRAVGGAGGVFAVGGVRVASGHVLGVAPLLDGARIWLGESGDAHAAPGPRQLRVVGGPDAGGVHMLGGGKVVIGRGDAADVRLADADASRVHAIVDARPDGVWVHDAGSANGTWLDGSEVGAEAVPLPPGALLRCGASLLVYTPPTDPPAAIRPDGVGGLSLHRPPRLPPRSLPTDLAYPAPPPDRPKSRFPWVLVMAPLVIGSVLWLITGGNSSYLLLTLLSPVMYGANALNDRFSGRRDHRRQLTEHRTAVERIVRERDEALAAESVQRRWEAPDPASLLLTVLGPGSRLWERRRADDDALALRLGTADLPARVVVRGSTDPPPTVRSVPVTVPLREVGVLGIAGPAAARQRLARWLVAQLAAWHTPRDLQLALLAESGEWGWFRWLPHFASSEGLPGVGVEQIAAQVSRLTALLESRQREDGAGPFVVLVLDGADRLRSVPGLARLLSEGPAARIFAVCLATDALELPEECGATAVLSLDGGAGLRVAIRGAPLLPDVTADLVSSSWIDRVARELAPIRDTTPGPAGSALPTQVRLADLLEPGHDTAAAIASRWRDAPRCTGTVLGVGVDGPISVDLRADGPHALVAGTTGAGKSELLQTLIAGLALANRPDGLTFILIDYKGGAAFADCARLPHTVGLVTDLDARLTARALDSLGAELRRRERLLADAGAKDLEAYQQLGGARLARLVIVIDEFASLVAELPDFVTGLVDIARRGRSLGVNLVLATQRPAGVVSAEIRANTALRICLRVTDSAESTDILDAPDAARISSNTPGRAYLRLAGGALTAIQTARVGGRPPAPHDHAPVVVASPWRGAPTELPPSFVDDLGPSDLARLVDVLTTAAHLAGAAALPSPWLPPLPELVTIADLPPADPHLTPLDQPDPHGDPHLMPHGQHDPHLIPLGLHDLPGEQRRATYCLDLTADRHLMVVGVARTGRTSALRAVAAGIAALPATDAHLYALDCGGGGLASLQALPHCGAVVPRDDTERGQRLLRWLSDELARRQESLTQAGCGSVAEQRAAVPPDERLPWLVLLVDSWEGFVHAYDGLDHGQVIDQVTHLLRDGPAGGLRVVITGERVLLTARAATLIPDRLVLRMADTDSYGLAGIPVREIPSRLPAGRALVCGGESVTEVQLALLDEDPSGPAQVAALARVGAVASRAGGCARSAGAADGGVAPRDGAADGGGASRRGAADGGGGPVRLRPLPRAVALADLVPAPGHLLFGVGGDDASPTGLSWADDRPGVLVAGPSGSGRSTALHTAAVHHLLCGGSVAVVTGPRSPLTQLHGAPGVLGMFDAHDGDALRRAVESSAERVLVVVDDADTLLDTSADTAICQLLADGHHLVLIAGTVPDLHGIYRGSTVEARRNRCGLLLSPTGPGDGELLGVRVSRGQEPRPGRGVLVHGGRATPIQVATAATRTPPPTPPTPPPTPKCVGSRGL